MRKYYCDIISAVVMEQLKAGTPVGEIKINTSAPYLKSMLANAFAKALSELPKEKVLHCWAPLQAAWDKKEELHAKAKADFARLFPNSIPDHIPEGSEPEPDSLIDTTDDFEDSDEADATVQQYQEYFGNLYDLGFRLVSIGP